MLVHISLEILHFPLVKECFWAMKQPQSAENLDQDCFWVDDKQLWTPPDIIGKVIWRPRALQQTAQLLIWSGWGWVCRSRHCIVRDFANGRTLTWMGVSSDSWKACSESYDRNSISNERHHCLNNKQAGSQKTCCKCRMYAAIRTSNTRLIKFIYYSSNDYSSNDYYGNDIQDSNICSLLVLSIPITTLSLSASSASDLYPLNSSQFCFKLFIISYISITSRRTFSFWIAFLSTCLLTRQYLYKLKSSQAFLLFFITNVFLPWKFSVCLPLWNVGVYLWVQSFLYRFALHLTDFELNSLLPFCVLVSRNSELHTEAS